MTGKELKKNQGKTVRSPYRFKRVKHFRAGISCGKKEWEVKREPVKGILIGVRTFSDGLVSRIEGGGLEYTPTAYFEVALIVPSWRHKPVPVALYDCKLVEDD